MDSRNFSFGMGYNPRSPNEYGFHFDPLFPQPESSVQPVPGYADAANAFRVAAGSSNEPYKTKERTRLLITKTCR